MHSACVGFLWLPDGNVNGVSGQGSRSACIALLCMLDGSLNRVGGQGSRSARIALLCLLCCAGIRRLHFRCVLTILGLSAGVVKDDSPFKLRKNVDTMT